METHPGVEYGFYQVILLKHWRRLDVVCSHIALQPREWETPEIMAATGGDIQVLNAEAAYSNRSPPGCFAVHAGHQCIVVSARRAVIITCGYEYEAQFLKMKGTSCSSASLHTAMVAASSSREDNIKLLIAFATRYICTVIIGVERWRRATQEWQTTRRVSFWHDSAQRLCTRTAAKSASEE